MAIAADLEALSVPIERLHVLPGNPRRGDVEAVARSLDAFGQRKPVVAQRDGTVIAGNHTLMAAQALGWPALAVVWTDDSDEVAKAFALADNRSSDLASYATDELVAMLRELDGSEWLAAASYTEDDLAELLHRPDPSSRQAELDDIGSKSPWLGVRNLPVDAIYTMGNPRAGPIIARQSGFMIGARSADFERFYLKEWLRLPNSPMTPLDFVDNKWREYDWPLHRDAVELAHPKYATVRDVMTRTQCKEAGVPYYPLPQILEWAQELEAFAERVIVIPKFDCLDKIPERYVLGYSIPTSYGGTPLSIEPFRGRPVHLLGGSWRMQRGYLAELREDIVSCDFNYLHLISHYGRFICPDGTVGDIRELPLPRFSNNRSICLAMSFGGIGMALHAIWPEREGSPFEPEEVESSPAPPEDLVDDER